MFAILVPGWVALVLLLLSLALMTLIVVDTIDDIRYSRAENKRKGKSDA